MLYRKKSFFCDLKVFVNQFFSRVLVKNKREMHQKKRIYVWVPVWGEAHIQMFFDYTLPSLLQENSIPKLRHSYSVELYVYTTRESLSTFNQIANEKFPDIEFNIVIFDEIKSYHSEMMLSFWVDMLCKAVDNDALVIIALPDFVFADNALFNAVELSNGKGVCIASSHPRVSYEGISKTAIPGRLSSGVSIEARELVKCSLNNPHITLSMMNDLEDINATADGISTRKIGENSVAVIHNLPAIYLVSPTKSDVTFFKRQVSFNSMDKTWPSYLLREMRLKYIGSSDLFFCAELTRDNEKSYTLNSGSKYNDIYSGIKPFCNTANSYISFWNGET